jgi:D-alanine transaminase
MPIREPDVPDVACVNGEFSPIEDARVSVEDRGLQFGDAVYEVLRAYDGRIFAILEHLDRLARSCRHIRLDAPGVLAELPGQISEALARSGYADAVIYIQLTRGAARRTHLAPDSIRPTCIVTVRRVEQWYRDEQANGVSAVGFEDTRWARCEIKSTDLLANVLLKQQARDQGAFEAILFDRQGELIEGASSNVFVAAGGVLRTPSLSPHVLAGVTRLTLLRLASGQGIPAEEGRITRDAMADAAEILLASTTTEVIPVVMFDGRPVGDGHPGPIARRLLEAYQSAVRGG